VFQRSDLSTEDRKVIITDGHNSPIATGVDKGAQGAHAPKWPGKNFFVKIEGLLEPVVLNLSFRVRSKRYVYI